MPTATKRRKLVASNASPKSRGLTAFTTVSKASTTVKAIIAKNTLVDCIAITPEPFTNDKKRKLVEESPQVPVTVDRAIKPLSAQRANSLRVPQTPKKPILNSSSPASIDTPTKGARSILDRFCISSDTPTKSNLSFNSSSSELIASTPEQPYSASSTELPIELLDLINLHAAFLTALSIHYAHNGTHSPADLRNLCPDVARAWGKRRVTLEDIRRSIGILNANILDGKSHRISRLSLSDYGHGKICIEIKIMGSGGRIARPVNEDLLNEIFERGLSTAWDVKDAELTTMDFIEKLPMEPITICPSLLKMSPLLAKGQRRLEDLKAGITVKQSEKRVVVNTEGPKLTLLERLRAKELHTSTLPAPPSKSEIARKAALGRIEEVVAVLVILSTSTSIGQSRISFTLPTVLGKLRDSFKTPMSKEEADTCVRLLADIAPKWVKLVKMGKVEALVVNRDERPTELDIKERVRGAA